MYSENGIGNRYFDFKEKELEILCKIADYKTYESFEKLQQRIKFIEGIFFEIAQTSGFNWTKKDYILPGLFEELMKILEDVISDNGKYKEGLDRYDRFLYEKKIGRVFNSIEYLTDLTKRKFIDLEDSFRYDLSEPRTFSNSFTHRTFGKLANKMSIRLKNSLTFLLNIFEDNVKDMAKKGITDHFQWFLQRLSVPYVTNPKLLSTEIYQSRYDLKKVREKVFHKPLKPSCANSEYHLGMKPIFVDQVSAYYFNYGEEEFILIVKRAKPELRLHEIPYSQSKPTILDLFAEIKKQDLFTNWFNNDKVKHKLLFLASNRIINNFLDTWKVLKEKRVHFEKSTKYLKKQFDLIKEYYGIIYDLNESIEIIKSEKKKCLLSYNIEEEKKTEQLEILEQLFPVIEN